MLELDGQRLSLVRIAAVASGRESVSLSSSARQRVEKSRLIVEKIVAEGRTVYGVNTGFGRLSHVRIDPTELRPLHLHLLPTHPRAPAPPPSTPEARALPPLPPHVP